MTTAGPRKRTRTLGALLLMAAGLGLMGMPSAQAAQIDVSFVLVDGSEMVIGGSPFPLFDPANPTSSGIVGQYDDVTGEFEGEFVSPARRATQTVDAPIAGTIDVVIDTVPISSDGHIDPVTGAVEVTSVFDLEMLFEQLVPTATPNSPVPLNVLCTIPAITLELTTDPPGFPPAVLGEGFALADDGFEVAEPECEGSVAGVDPAIVGLVRGGLIDRLSLPTTDTAIFLEFAPGDLTDAEPLEPLAAPPTTVAPVAPVAPAVAVQAPPRLTG